MRFREQYDWAVLGDHPGALLSGALAARLGLSVLILPLSPSFGLQISKSGLCLDPESNYLHGLGESNSSRGLLNEALDRLGILPAESQLIRNSAFALSQILTPQHRIQLGSDEQSFAKSLERELGEAASGQLALIAAIARARKDFERYWMELPERLTLVATKEKASGPASKPLALKDLRRQLAKATRDPNEAAWIDSDEKSFALGLRQRFPAIQEILSGLHYGVGGQFASDPAISDSLLQIALGYSGASYVGGVNAIRQLLLRIARRHGALVSEKAECRRIFIENGRFVGVQLSHRGEMISVGGGVLGCALEHAAELMTSSGKAYRTPTAAPKPVGWKFSVALTVHAEAVPPGASSRMVWQERNAPPLEIEIAEPGHYGVRNPERQLIFLRTVLPFSDETLTPQYQSMIGARMLRQAIAVIPYLEYHVLRIYPDFRHSADPSVLAPGEGLADLYTFSTLSQIPENLRCYGGSGMGSRSGVEGLFIGSGEAYPEFGSLGGTIAAIEAVAWLAHRSGLPGPMA